MLVMSTVFIALRHQALSITASFDRPVWDFVGEQLQGVARDRQDERTGSIPAGSKVFIENVKAQGSRLKASKVKAEKFKAKGKR
jgi:hypothetical protein